MAKVSNEKDTLSCCRSDFQCAEVFNSWCNEVGTLVVLRLHEICVGSLAVIARKVLNKALNMWNIKIHMERNSLQTQGILNEADSHIWALGVVNSNGSELM